MASANGLAVGERRGFIGIINEIVKLHEVVKIVLPVILAIFLSLVINSIFPRFNQIVASVNYEGVNLVILFCVFVMIATVIQKVDLKTVQKPSLRYFGVAHGLTWIVKPTLQFLTASFFFYVVFSGVVGYPKEYTVGMTLMAFAPCTVMVMVWSFLSGGNLVHAYLSTLINIFLIATVYPVIGYLYIGAAFLKVSYFKILYATTAYFIVPSLIGLAIKVFYKSPSLKLLTTINVSALTLNIFTLFTLWNDRLRNEFLDLILVSVPTLVRIIIVVAIFYPIIRRVENRNASKSGTIIGTSDNIELAIVVFSVLFGLNSPVFLPVLANILMEIPAMIVLVAIFLLADQRRETSRLGLESELATDSLAVQLGVNGSGKRSR